MKKFKKILFCAIITFSLSLTSIPFVCAKPHSITVNGVTYIYERFHTDALIYQVYTDAEELSIPETLNGINVYGIVYQNPETEEFISVFSNSPNLKTITLPNTMRRIGRRAFYNCVNLERIILPANLNCIEEEAFKNCENLKFIGINIFIADKNDIINAINYNFHDIFRRCYFHHNLI